MAEALWLIWTLLAAMVLSAAGIVALLLVVFAPFIIAGLVILAAHLVANIRVRK